MLIQLDFSAVLASWPLLVRGVVWTIGLTIVGFGTSAPELLVSVQAALANQPGIAIGNVAIHLAGSGLVNRQPHSRCGIAWLAIDPVRKSLHVSSLARGSLIKSNSCGHHRLRSIGR